MGGGTDHDMVDGELLGRALAGDHEAALLILDPHRRRIIFATAALNKDQRLDVFHDMVVDAAKLLRNYDPERPLGPYLFRIAQNRARRMLSDRRPPEIDIAAADERGLVRHLPSIDDPDVSIPARLTLEELLGALDDEELIILRTCTNHLSDETAARLLSLSTAGVRTRRRRLRKRLERWREGTDGSDDR